MRRTERLLVALSLVFGLGYPLLWGLPLQDAAMIAAKGAAMGSLALAAASQARSADGGLLAAVIGLGAAGDVLLEIDFAAGAASFAAGHLIAIVLYRRNPRAGAGVRHLGVAAFPPALAAILVLLLLDGRPEALLFLLYAVLLGTMAGTAMLSRFPRIVPLGAALFLASDMLIAARLGSGAEWLSWPIWYLYYVGQLMIFVGVTSALPPRERSSGGGGPPEVVEG